MSRAATAGHGLTPLEQQVMDLWDDGLAMAKIATRLDMTVRRVGGIVSTYRISPQDRFEAAARAASDALLAAIRRAHPEMVDD